MAATTQNGKYTIIGWFPPRWNGDCFAMVEGIGLCRYSNKLSAILIPGVGWVIY